MADHPIIMITLTLTEVEAQQLITLLLNSNPLVVKIINQIQQGQRTAPTAAPNGLDPAAKEGGEP